MTGPARQVLLVGGRRMPALGERIQAVAPGLSVRIAADPAAGEAHLAESEIVVVAARLTPAYATARHVRWMHLYPTGVDHVTIPALVEAPFVITHKAWASVVPMAEHGMALMLQIARRLAEFRDLQNAREWRRFDDHPATTLIELRGRTLTILGYGRVGRALARRARAFDMRIIGVKRSIEAEVGDLDLLLPTTRLREALAETDFLIVTTPLNDGTVHLIGESELRAMQPTAWLINIGRGPVVDTRAVLRALQEGRLGGAALDVFEAEPLPSSDALWSHPNVIITPHVAGSGPENEREATEEILANLRRFLDGQPLEGILNRADIPTGPPRGGH